MINLKLKNMEEMKDKIILLIKMKMIIFKETKTILLIWVLQIVLNFIDIQKNKNKIKVIILFHKEFNLETKKKMIFHFYNNKILRRLNFKFRMIIHKEVY